MKNWGSIQRGSTLVENSDKPGCVLATNSRFLFNGELRRRKGMARTNIPQYSANVVGVASFTRIPGFPGIAVVTSDGAGDGASGRYGPVTDEVTGPGVPHGGGDFPNPVKKPSIQVKRGAIFVLNNGIDTIGNIIEGDARVLSYSITNGGTANLTISGEITGGESNCSISVVALPDAIVAPGATTVFSVQVIPNGVGDWTFGMQFNNNVAGSSPFSWTPVGECLAKPAINIFVNDIIAIPNEITSIGASGTPVTVPCYAKNVGGSDLTISRFEYGSSANLSSVVVTPSLITVIPPGGRFDFSVTMNGATGSPYIAYVFIWSDSQYAGFYRLFISGTTP